MQDKRLSKLNIMFQNVRTQNQRLENEAKLHQVLFEETQHRMSHFGVQVSHLSDTLMRYREIALMQREDGDSRIESVKDQLRLADKAREKLKKLQFKVDR